MEVDIELYLEGIITNEICSSFDRVLLFHIANGKDNDDDASDNDDINYEEFI